jgi:hypothetical protein
MKKFAQRPTQKFKILQRGTLIAGGVSIVAMAAYLLIGIQTAKTNSSAASGFELLTNDPINNGEILCGYTWEDTVSKADVGPGCRNVSKDAMIENGGRDNSRGLSAGTSGKNINMDLGNDPLFNSDGADMSIDFCRYEATGNFFSRGNYFNFGMKNGFLCIKYRLKKENGKNINVDEMTRYEIPLDTVFRNYRFIYNAVEAKGEVFVDNIPVWSSSADEGDKLCWNTGDPLILGNEINGESKGRVVFDNLIIRSTSRGRTMPLRLLSFTAELRGENVMINWFTAKEENVDYFRVEKSSDTYSYKEIGRVKASGNSSELKAYALLDMHPGTGISYYRLSLPNTDVKSVWVPVIALRIKENMLPKENTEINSMK